jgi:hypothetical protein
VAPQIASLESQLGQNGQGGSSFAGGELGSLESAGALNSYNAGLNYAQQNYNDQLQGLSAYYSGPVGLEQSQNQAAVNTGLNEYNAASNTAGMQNSYGLDTTGMQNSFDLSNFSNADALYSQQLQARSNMFSSIFGGLTGLAGDAIDAGGGGGNKISPAPAPAPAPTTTLQYPYN